MDRGGEEVNVINDDVPESISGDVMHQIKSVGDILMRVELGTACSSEKSDNLNMLMMHVATKENEYKAFISDKELMLKESANNVLYLDFLCGILDSEVNELENYISTLQTDIIVALKYMVSYEDPSEDLERVEKMLQNSEELLKQSLDQVSDIKVQSSDIQRNLSRSSAEDTWKGRKAIERLEDDNISDPRKTLKMLDRSLAREIDLEKSIAESREAEEVLKLRLHLSEHENLCMEEEDLLVLERLFEGENTAEVLMGISKELFGQIQKLIFSLNASRNREDHLKLKLEDSIRELKAKDASLQMMTAKAAGDKDQNLLQKLYEMRSTQDDLKEKIRKEEGRADRAEANCKLLTESNIELNVELNLLKASGNTTLMVESLERKMSESDIVLQRAMASAEASREKENMLNSTIEDMENLIENLKSKALKANDLAESAEDKCIELSECNSDLTEKLLFLKGQMDCLKVSLHQAEESKKTTAKDIRTRTEMITEMVTHLAFERERLQKQISSLTKQNKLLVNQCQQTSKNQVKTSHDVIEDTEILTPTVTMRDRNSANMDRTDIDGGPDDCRLDFKTVKNIDARQLNMKYVIMMFLVLVISIFAALLFQTPDSGF